MKQVDLETESFKIKEVWKKSMNFLFSALGLIVATIR